jgi:hypothetical protein
MVATHSRNGYASVDALLSLAPLEETDHTLSNGAKVRFRKLSRHGQLKVKAYAAKPDYDEEEGERLLFSFCLVAEPPFDGAEDERLIRMQDEMDTTILAELRAACYSFAIGTPPKTVGPLGEEVSGVTTATFPAEPGPGGGVLSVPRPGVEVG